MADFGAPVAQNAAYDSSKGLATISGLLGLKQQKLAIQSQQQGLQGQAAQVQQEQLKAHEQQGVQDFFNAWDPSQHVGADGTTDTDSARQSDVYKNSGNAKPAIDLKLAQVKAAQLGNKQALTSLNKDNLTQLGQVTQSLAQDPDVIADKTDPVTGVNAGRIKTREALQNFAALSPDASRVANLYAPLLKGARPGHLATGLRQIALQGQDIAGAQSQTNPEMVSVDTGPAIQFGTADKATGKPTFNGPAVTKGLAPTQTPGYLSTVASQTAAAGAGGTNDESAYSEIQKSGAASQKIASLSDDVAQLAKAVQTGALSKGMADKYATVMQSLGLSTVGADSFAAKRQLLGKAAAQLRLQANVANGANSDAARQEVADAYPNPDQMSPGAIQEAARYVKGLAGVNQARLNNADKFRSANNGSSLGVRAIDNQFTQQADPKAFVYQNLQPGPERQQFVQDHFTDPKTGKLDKKALEEFQTKRAILNHGGAFGGSQ